MLFGGTASSDEQQPTTKFSARSFQPDFAWDQTQERVGQVSHKDFLNPEDEAEKIFQEAEKFWNNATRKNTNNSASSELWNSSTVSN